MNKHIVITLALLAAVSCHESRKRRVEDPFALLDRHISNTLAYHYLWPWSQLFKAAVAIDEEGLEDPQIESDQNTLRLYFNARRFKPDELKVRVKNRYIIVEGKHKETTQNQQFMANHFVQRFVMPPGSKQEEVTAVLNEKGILTITVPKHELPPPPPEREVPIEVKIPENKSESPIEASSEQSSSESPVSSEKPQASSEKYETSSAKIDTSSAKIEASSITPNDLDLSEATTHVGKIRKKDLKTTIKTTKDNEVTKGIDTNGLDYSLLETDVE